MKDLVNRKTATIVDVRTPMEFIMGKVKGSKNIPMDKVANRLEDFRKMNKPVILCCASGNRSGQVVKYLESQGIDEVYNGGGWREVKAMLEENE